MIGKVIFLHVFFNNNSQKMAASPPFLLAPAPHPTNAMDLNIPSQILIPGYHFYLINNSCSTKFAPKSGPGLADVGILHGDGDGPRTPPRCLEGCGKSFK